MTERGKKKGEGEGGREFLILKGKCIPLWSVCMQAEEDGTLFKVRHSTNTLSEINEEAMGLIN